MTNGLFECRFDCIYHLISHININLCNNNEAFICHVSRHIWFIFELEDSLIYTLSCSEDVLFVICIIFSRFLFELIIICRCITDTYISIKDVSDCVFVALDANQFGSHCYTEDDSVKEKNNSLSGQRHSIFMFLAKILLTDALPASQTFANNILLFQSRS